MTQPLRPATGNEFDRRWLRRAAPLLLLLLCTARQAAAVEVLVDGGTYTLSDHPRILFDGPSGARVRALRDPDGVGPGLAPLAIDANPAYGALKQRRQACRADPPACAAQSMAPRTLLSALDWFMDRSQSTSLAGALMGLEQIERQATGGFGFGCDLAAADCGIGAESRRAAADLVYYALTYTLVRDQMSAAQRSLFARKMLNHVDKGYGDGCSNQLQDRPGIVANYDGSSNVLRGSGFDQLQDGQRLYLRDDTGQAGWGSVNRIEGSSVLTLTGPLRTAARVAAGPINLARVSVLEAWNEGTCGIVWLLQQLPHQVRGRAINFRQSKLASSIDAQQEQIAIGRTAGLPHEPPYFLSIDGREVVEVTGGNSSHLRVKRGRLGTTPVAARSGLPVYYSRTIPNVGTTDEAHGAVVQNLLATAFVANALADESPYAASLLGDTASDWRTRVLPKNKDMWSGFQQGGSGDYGAAGGLTHNAAMTAMLRELHGEPRLDASGGNWLKYAVPAYLYTTLPDRPMAFMPWGEPTDAPSSTVFAHAWAAILRGLYGADADPMRDWTHWQHSLSGSYQAEALARPEAERLLPFLLMYERPDQPRRDYRDIYPTQRAFQQVDGNPSRAIAAWVSRSGWQHPDDTLLFMAAFSNPWTQDHLGAGAPAAYKIYKRGWTLSENGPFDTGAGVDTNMVLLGGAANLTPSRLVTVIRMAGDDTTGAFAYVQVNSQAAYHVKASATRVLRSIVHLKKPSTRDYIFVYDTLETWKGISKTIHLHFDRAPGEVDSMASAVLPQLAWIGPNRRLDTVVVLPSGSEVAARHETVEHAHRVAVCASTDGSTCDAKNRKATFLMVHRPHSMIGEPMVAVRRLDEIDATHVGVQVEGADPKVVLFPVEGAAQTHVSFRTTHAGRAQVLVTGIRSGTYDIKRNGKTVCAKVIAAPKGDAVYCELESGAISVEAAPVPKP